jgi:mono/diheme cytochrome c family protein
LGRFSTVILLASCSGERVAPPADEASIPDIVLQANIPESLAAGEAAFNANCSVCHGDRALGTPQGPPLVHIIYESSHHGDVAFVLAAERGVRAHHWNFGDMPPLPEVSRAQVEQITAYIRHLQRLVGIQ